MTQKEILLVEDNPDDEALTLRAFQKSKLANQVAVARDGAEALDYLFGEGAHAGREHTDPPAVILLDLKLPKIDGIDVLRRLRLRADTRTRHTPVVILTSSREERDIVEAYELRANSYIRKPVDFEQFVQAVREIGLYWLLWNEPVPK